MQLIGSAGGNAELTVGDTSGRQAICAMVDAIEPGMIASDLMMEHQNEDISMKITRPFPAPRPGTSNEIADAVLYMTSAQANHITGSTLLVDGGASMAPLGCLEQALNR